MDEVAAALKKMKRHKAPVMSGLVAEMIQSTGDIGTQWILDLCNRIVKEGCIPEDWKSSMVLPIYKGKADPMECGSYRGIKLLEYAMKVVERIFENRIRHHIDIGRGVLEGICGYTSYTNLWCFFDSVYLPLLSYTSAYALHSLRPLRP